MPVMLPPETPPIPPSGRQLLLPRYQDTPLHVSDAVSVVRRDGFVWWFHQGMPLGSHAESDVASFRHQSSMLCDGDACKLVEIERAFEVSAISVKRALKQYRAGGVRSFFESGRWHDYRLEARRLGRNQRRSEAHTQHAHFGLFYREVTTLAELVGRTSLRSGGRDHTMACEIPPADIPGPIRSGGMLPGARGR